MTANPRFASYRAPQVSFRAPPFALGVAGGSSLCPGALGWRGAGESLRVGLSERWNPALAGSRQRRGNPLTKKMIQHIFMRNRTGNFRSDGNVSGSINASDIGLVPGLRSPAVQIAFRTSIIL